MNFLIDLLTFDLRALAAVALAAWVYLCWARAGFWRADVWLTPEPAPAGTDGPMPAVAVIIPARNEAETISRTLHSLTAQDYDGPLDIWVIDDQSTDATGALARAASTPQRPVRVIDGTDLPAGWSGKVWAQSQGIAALAAAGQAPTYVLLTDADIAYRQGVVAKMVRKAEARALTFVSLMARLDARGLWGHLLVPAFIYFFQLIYPFKRANTLYDPMAGAAGGCFLIRRDALEAAGGMQAIKGDIIDDCALAGVLKRARPAQATLTALTHDVRSLRDNRSLTSIWNMVARTAFTQLRHSWLALCGAIAGLVLVFVIPAWAAAAWLVGAATAATGLMGLAAVALMVRTYRPTVKLYGLKAWWALTLPVAAMVYAGATVTSAIRHARGTGARWKGRSYAAGSRAQ